MEFNPQKQLAGLLEWMDQQMALCHGKTAVIGISGGKDSSTVAALAVAAYGRENVYGVLIPDGVQPDIDYSQALVEHLNIPHCTINIHDAVQGVLHEMEQAGLEPSRQTRVNLPSRIRMATLYAVAQTVPDGIVINTSNLSEDWVGYCTIYGDSAGAFSPLGMYTTEEVIAPSTTYLRIYFAGIIFVFIYNVGSSILRAVGDSRRPLYYLIVCCFINILLDVVLVVFFHMGVAGAAIATVFAQGVSAVLVVLALCRSRDIFRLELKQVRFHRDALELLLKIGLPAGLQSVMYSASNIIIQTSLNSFGTNTMAAWTAYGKIDSFFWMVISAFGISITTFVGQNYGARKFGRMRKSVRICLGMAMGASVVISAVFLIFGKYVYQLFTTDATVIEIGMHMMTLMAPAYAVYVFIEVYSGALRGTGDVLVPMLMTCGGVCVLRVLWVLFVVPLKPVIDTILYSYPISWTLTALLFIFYYRKKCQQFPDSDE